MIMIYKIVLSNLSFFYITGNGLFPVVEAVEDSDDFIILFYNYEKEVISQVFFSTVKSVFAVHYESIEPFYEDVTEELRLQCKSSRGGASGDNVRPPFGEIVFDFEDYILRFLSIGADIAIVISVMLILKHFLKLF